MSFLIITLPPEGAGSAALLDYVLSPDGRTVAQHARVPLALLPASARHEVVLVLPAQALSWHRVKLPAGSLPRALPGERTSARLRTILDGLLEDQLLDEPAQMHLALQPQPGAQSSVWVAACDRSWLGAGLLTLAQAGHAVNRIVPELSVHDVQGRIFVTEHGEAAQVVAALVQTGQSPDASPAAMLVGTLSADLCALLGSAGESGEPTPLDAAPQVLAEPAVAALAEQAFGRPVTVQQRAERLLQAAQSPWELAQFDLAHVRRDRRFAALAQGLRTFWQAPAWRPARWALVALLGVNLVGLNAWAWQVKANLQAQRQAVRAVLTETFPKIPVVVDAPLQMAREVAQLQRSKGRSAGSDLESVLAQFSTLAPAEYALNAIEFGSNGLLLSGPPMPPAQQAAVQAALQERGWRVSVQGNDWLITVGGGA